MMKKNLVRISICFWLILSITAFFISCKEDNHKQEITQIIKEWQGKEIIFPENLIFTQFGKDTIPYQIPDAGYKIILYVDSVGCTSCGLQLHKWKGLIDEVDSLSNETVPVLFFFHPKDLREISYLLKRDDMAIPVCIDEKDILNSINNFPKNHNFQCFLIDSDNKVVFIGNPIHNFRIKEMYLATISGKESQPISNSPKTEIEVKQTEFDLGIIDKGIPTTITVAIKNIGERPFIIQKTRESCGCTKVKYERKPILPAVSTEVKITYDAQGNGYFSKTVFIYGNIENSPLIINIRGHLK